MFSKKGLRKLASGVSQTAKRRWPKIEELRVCGLTTRVGFIDIHPKHSSLDPVLLSGDE